jgi:hypothetical protein
MNSSSFYSFLTNDDAFVLAEFFNDIRQYVVLVEHPFHGEDYGVCVMFPEHKVAFRSGFYDIDDLVSNSDYMPFFADGELKLAYELQG